ncbi:DUF2871 domain-containing protein [Tessaracoccus antarcticus]|uniref:DUF2871 domain-containing protein n=1 Tax=Tessaracoccus antarcticus TaxID=2479848 RepID=A0A3M0G8X7_9ACTN|nr:DUF2871 domain-containing protein [Tessaracoccus antarcticus]RMB61490.1 DUF2871 domain-containing protein [Tessaracoccus antarcticus]
MTRATTWFFRAAAAWTGAGLLAGLYYRELTRSTGHPSGTQLAVAHTHLLVLGTVFGLLFLVLERQYDLSRSKLFPGLFWTWIAGTAVTAGSQVFKGSLQVLGSAAADSKAIAGISGLGHITLTVAFVLFFLALRSRLKADVSAPHAELVSEAF